MLKSKAERQAHKRALGLGARAARQQREHRQGANTRIYESLGPGRGYIQIRIRDGKQVSRTPA